MKNLITIFAICFGLGILNGQAETETLEWLNIKKMNFTYFGTNNQYLENDWNELILDSNNISYNGSEVRGQAGTVYFFWNNIKEIIMPPFEELAANEWFIIKVKTNMADSTVSFYTKDYILTEKFVKALKRMAILKGAKLINDDLF